MAPVWEPDPVLFRLPFLGLSIRWYGVIFSAVFLGGFLLFRWRTLKTGGTENQAWDVIAPGFVGLLVGARLGHVLFYNLDLFLRDPWWLFRVWEGGLTSHGAAIGLAAALWWYSRRTRIPFLTCADRFVFSAALGAGLVRLGNLMNSEIVGKVADAAWAVRFPLYDGLPGALSPPRYPTQLLELALGLGILLILVLAARRPGPDGRDGPPKGALTALFLVLYFTGRFLVEFLKERQGPADNLLLSRGQLLSIPGVLAGLALGWASLRREPASGPRRADSDAQARSGRAPGKPERAGKPGKAGRRKGRR